MKLIQKNGTDIILNNTKNTPRTAVCLYFSIDEAEKYSGVYSLFSKLLLKGTKTRSEKELADIIEGSGMEVSAKCKQDFLKLSALFLNEDFDLGLDILADIMLNSTFDDFEKEVYKLRGEIISELDSPQVKASDSFIEGIFNGHYYGNSYRQTLEELDKIKKEDITAVLGQIMRAKKVISVAGDFADEDSVVKCLEDKFSFMKSADSVSKIPDVTAFGGDDGKDKIIKIPKNDAKQAQIFQGFIVDTRYSADYPKLAVMNNLLGASGLSSRLFVELRDKQGLAYTVRSSLEPLKHSALFYFYIGTEPNNIEKSLQGFRAEIKKLIEKQPDEVELLGAKENIMGRLEYFSQTNMQLASIAGYDYIMGLGLDYEQKYRDALMKVSADDVSRMAEKYLQNPSMISILAPDDYLK